MVGSTALVLAHLGGQETIQSTSEEGSGWVGDSPGCGIRLTRRVPGPSVLPLDVGSLLADIDCSRPRNAVLASGIGVGKYYHRASYH